MKRHAAAAGLVLLAVAGAGCSGGPASGRGGSGPRGTVVVLAAASLTGAFTTLAREFEHAHPGAHVRLSFGGSSDLAAQVVQGAPADVFAAASPATMRTVTAAGAAAGPPTDFVRNRLEIALAPQFHGHVVGLTDLARPGLKLALCAPQVPCGAAAAKAFRAAGVLPHPVTEEQDVKAVLTKVELGEVDAGLVYRTDVRAAAGKVRGVDFPQAAAAVNDYPIAVLTGGGNAAGGRAFVAFVLSPAGRRVLTAAGFEAP